MLKPVTGQRRQCRNEVATNVGINERRLRKLKSKVSCATKENQGQSEINDLRESVSGCIIRFGGRFFTHHFWETTDCARSVPVGLEHCLGLNHARYRYFAGPKFA